MVDTEIRLNLGSRETRIEGFLNMDIDAHPGVDVVGDVSDLSRYKDGEVSEIIASQILEHFPHVKTLDVLKEWYRVLAPGGHLYVGVPDFGRAVELYGQVGLVDWIQNQLMGDQVYGTAFHYALFDEDRLARLLYTVGFSEINVYDLFPFDAECSNKLSTLDNRPVSLNLRATK